MSSKAAVQLVYRIDNRTRALHFSDDGPALFWIIPEFWSALKLLDLTQTGVLAGVVKDAPTTGQAGRGAPALLQGHRLGASSGEQDNDSTRRGKPRSS